MIRETSFSYFYHQFPSLHLSVIRLLPLVSAISSYYTCFFYQQQEQNSLFSRKSYAKRTKKCFAQLREEPTGIARKGSIAGAVALIIGTSIGSGILALPQKASPAVLSKSLFYCFDLSFLEKIY